MRQDPPRAVPAPKLVSTARVKTLAGTPFLVLLGARSDISFVLDRVCTIGDLSPLPTSVSRSLIALSLHQRRLGLQTQD